VYRKSIFVAGIAIVMLFSGSLIGTGITKTELAFASKKLGSGANNTSGGVVPEPQTGTQPSKSGGTASAGSENATAAQQTPKTQIQSFQASSPENMAQQLKSKLSVLPPTATKIRIDCHVIYEPGPPPIYGFICSFTWVD
jgi:hypothetical protein